MNAELAAREPEKAATFYRPGSACSPILFEFNSDRWRVGDDWRMQGFRIIE